MLSVAGGPSRRGLLAVGSLSLSGLALPEARAAGPAPAGRGNGFGRARAVILVYLQGSPSHIDLWGPKPDAPAGGRGGLKPVAAAAPGLRLTEVLPHRAKQADRFCLVRSVGVKPRGLANHGAAICMLLTGCGPGNFSPTGLAVPPSREDLPSVGAVCSRFRPAPAGALGYVALGAPAVGVF